MGYTPIISVLLLTSVSGLTATPALFCGEVAGRYRSLAGCNAEEREATSQGTEKTVFVQAVWFPFLSRYAKKKLS